MRMTEREKMLSGRLYDCGDPELLERWHLAKDLIKQYNGLSSADLKAKDSCLAVAAKMFGLPRRFFAITEITSFSEIIAKSTSTVFFLMTTASKSAIMRSLVRRFKFTRRSIRRIFENGLLCRGKRVSLLFAVRRRLR